MSRSTLRSLSAALLLSLSVPFLAHAQSAAPAPTTAALPRVQLDEILSSQNRARTLTQVAISPDAKRLAWLEAGQIRVAPFDNLVQSQPVTAAPPGQSCNAANLIWSPDSAAIAFLSDCADPGGQPDLFVSHLDGKSAVRLTKLHGYVDAPAFSPDGKSIAFLYVEGATRPSGALAAETPPAGVIGEDHVEIQRVALVPADASQPAVPTTVTPPSLHVFEFDWSPDSKSLAYVAADPPGENNWWVAKLYTQPVAAAAIAKPSGAPGPGSPRTGLRPGSGDPSAAADETWDTTDPKPTAIVAPADVAGPLHGLQIAVPRWSPDGKTIAFIGGLMSDQGVTGGDVWLVSSVFGQSSTGPQPTNLTPGRPTSAQWIAWDDDQSLYVAEIAGGDDRLIHLQIPASPGPPASSDSPVFTIPGDVGSGQSKPSASSVLTRSWIRSS